MNLENKGIALTYDDIQLIPAPISNIKSRKNISLYTPITYKHYISTPIIASPMNTVVDEHVMLKMNNLGTVAILPRFMSNEDRLKKINYVYQNRKNKNIPIAVSYGLNDTNEFLNDMYLSGADIFLLDIANGHNINAWIDVALRKLYFLKSHSQYKIPEFILGNLATEINEIDWIKIILEIKKHTKGDINENNLFEYHTPFPSAFRVGIGSGSVCTTRISTGFGIPMIQSIINIKKSLYTLSQIYSQMYNIIPGLSFHHFPIIADGGIRTPGDAMKAIAVGASSIMLGSLLADTVESPSPVIEKDGKKYKVYEGSASFSAKVSSGSTPEFIEGVKTLIPYNENKTIESVIHSFNDGLRSGLSYAGYENILQRNKFLYYEITNAGMIEARPHLKDKIKW
jgi:IMP dehydrogenase